MFMWAQIMNGSHDQYWKLAFASKKVSWKNNLYAIMHVLRKAQKMNNLQTAIEQKGWLLADGATGTSLFNMGLEAGEAPELWNVERPDCVRKLYRESIAAGVDLFLTNTFGGNSSRLKLHQAHGRVKELNMAAAELARNEVDRSGQNVLIAGSIGPTGEILQPVGSLSEDDAVSIFHEQAEALKDGGVDFLWVETISSMEEFRPSSCAALADIDWCGTMSFDTAGRTMMGVTSADLAKMVEKLPKAPLAFGANCGVGASDLLRTILGFAAQGTERPTIAKGNAGIPKFHDGHIHYDGTPDLMADYAVLARDCGATIIGGCCGTTPEHLRKMKVALETQPSSKIAPSLETIAKQLGDFSSLADGTGEDAPRRERRRERRRVA